MKYLVTFPLVFLTLCLPAFLSHFLAFPVQAATFLGPPTPGPTSTLYFFHQDHLSSNSIMTDENGNVVSTAKFQPYGEERERTGTKIGERTYTDQIKDDSTNLMYYNARYYNPKLGIFTQPDQIGGLAKYSYASGNPIRFNDPSGNMETDESGGGEEQQPPEPCTQCHAPDPLQVRRTDPMQAYTHYAGDPLTGPDIDTTLFEIIKDAYAHSYVGTMSRIDKEATSACGEDIKCNMEYQSAHYEEITDSLINMMVGSVQGVTTAEVATVLKAIDKSKYFNPKVAPWYKQSVVSLLEGDTRGAYIAIVRGTNATARYDANIRRGTYLVESWSNPGTFHRYLNTPIEGELDTVDILNLQHQGKSMDLIVRGLRSPLVIDNSGQAMTNVARFANQEAKAVDELLKLDAYVGGALKSIGNSEGYEATMHFARRR